MGSAGQQDWSQAPPQAEPLLVFYYGNQSGTREERTPQPRGAPVRSPGDSVPAPSAFHGLSLGTKTSDLRVVFLDWHHQRSRRAGFLADKQAEGPPRPLLRALTAHGRHEAAGSSGCCAEACCQLHSSWNPQDHLRAAEPPVPG